MKKILLSITALSAVMAFSQEKTGVNTTSPKTTLDVVGSPSDAQALDGIMSPRLTGDELQAKNYTSDQKGAMVYVTVAASTVNQVGQTVNVKEEGQYIFDGTVWTKFNDTNDQIWSKASDGKIELNDPILKDSIQYAGMGYRRFEKENANFTGYNPSTNQDVSWNTQDALSSVNAYDYDHVLFKNIKKQSNNGYLAAKKIEGIVTSDDIHDGEGLGALEIRGFVSGNNSKNYRNLSGIFGGATHDGTGKVNWVRAGYTYGSVGPNAKADWVVGLMSTAGSYSENDIPSVTGSYSSAIVRGTGNVSDVEGQEVVVGGTKINSDSPGITANIENMYGTKYLFETDDIMTGTINNIYSNYLKYDIHAGTPVNNAYGLYIEDLPTQVTGNKYAIYTKAGKVRFGDMPLSTEATDKIVVADSDGVLKTQSASSLVSANAEWKDGADLIYANQAKAAGKDVVVTDDGEIGIGTTSPKAFLDVAGSIRLAKDRTSFTDINSYPTQNSDNTLMFGAPGSHDSFEIFRTGYSQNTLGDGNGTLFFNGIDRGVAPSNISFVFGSTLPSKEFTPILYMNGQNHKVGIGTLAPTEKLHVSGKARIEELPTSTGSTDKVVLADSNGVLRTKDASSLVSANAEWKDGTNTTGTNIIYANQAKTAGKDVVVTDGGDVGIGTNTPAAKLDVKGKFYLHSENNPGTIPNDYGLIGYTAKYGRIAVGNIAGTTVGSNGAEPGDAGLWVNGKNAFSDTDPNKFANGAFVAITNANPNSTIDLDNYPNNMMIFNKEGDLGVGVKVPTQKLEVNGNISVGRHIDGRETGTNVAGAKLIFNGVATNTDGVYMQKYNNSGDKTELRVGVGDNNQGDDKFVIGSNVDMLNYAWTPFFTVVNNGRVGIGTDNPKQALQIGDRWTFHDGGDKVIGYNYDWKDGKAYRMADDAVSRVIFNGGGVYFNVAPNGTAGSEILTSDNINVLSIKNNGRVGIGVASPTQKLEVAGKVKATAFIAGTQTLTVPDYVFEDYYQGRSVLKPTYQFKTLNEVENFVKSKGHLPGYQSAKEIKEKGSLDMTATQLTNIEKIEELYLHTIEQEKKIEDQALQLEEKDTKISELEIRLERLEKLLLKK